MDQTESDQSLMYVQGCRTNVDSFSANIIFKLVLPCQWDTSRRFSRLWVVFGVKSHHPHLLYWSESNPTVLVYSGVPSIFRDPDSFHLGAPLEALKSFTESSASCQERREERAEGIMQEVLGARKWFTLLTHHFSHSISRSQSNGPCNCREGSEMKLSSVPRRRRWQGLVSTPASYPFALSPPNLQ